MEKKIFNLSETLDSSINRIDKFLQSQLKNFSRTKLQKLIKNGFVRINDKTIKLELYFPLQKKLILDLKKYHWIFYMMTMI